jgi:hypothetical protein
MLPMRPWARLLLITAAAFAVPTVAWSAPTDLLINAPAGRACAGKGTIRVGVWYRAWAGGSRKYAVRIFDPAGRVVFSRAGSAPNRYWSYHPLRPGVYQTVYFPKTRFSTFKTRVVSCSGQPSPSSIGWRVVASKSATGQFAVTAVNATVNHPRQIAIRLIGQVETGSASIACSKDFSIASWSREYSRAGLYVLPMTPGAESCDIIGSVGGSGTVTVQVLSK